MTYAEFIRTSDRCWNCRTEQREEGRTCCRPCLDIIKAQVFARRDRYEEQGRCVHCGGERDRRGVLCNECREAQCQANRDRWQRIKAERRSA